MRRRLPMLTEASLDSIAIATPCTVAWNDLHGDDRVRRCGHCQLNVYDISAMTRAEAVTLIATNEMGRTCVKLHRRADGTLLTQDCWERLGAARRRGWLVFAAACVVVALTQLGLRFAAIGWLIKRQPPHSDAANAPPPSSERSPNVMGGIAVRF